jgi:hypothetical protein
MTVTLTVVAAAHIVSIAAAVAIRIWTPAVLPNRAAEGLPSGLVIDLLLKPLI